MGSSKGGDDAAQQERADENARQARITAGTADINKIFDGSTVGTGAVASGTAYDPSAKYYNADGTAWTPSPTTAGGGQQALGGFYNTGENSGTGVTAGSTGGGSGGPVFSAGSGATGSSAASQTQAQKDAAAFAAAVAGGKIYSGTQQNGGFNDDFWNQRSQSYVDYANPQITDQYDDAAKQLTFALDRAGTLDSSVRGQKLGDLQKLYDKNLLNMNDQAQGYVNSGKTAVEDARSNLITTLNATGDAQQAASDAIARSQTLAQAPTYSPLTNLFTDFTNTLGNAQAQNYALAAATGYGGGGATSGSGLNNFANSVQTRN